MTAIYVLRHPETTWNVAQRYQGRLESELSGEGMRQAKLACEAFAGETLDAVYSSPLNRALQLAHEVARTTQSPLRIDQRLTEVGQCPWEGRTLLEIRSTYPDLYQQWYERPDEVRFPGGESLDDVQRRALSTLSSVFQRHPNGHVAVVTHSVVIQVLVASALSLDLRYIHRIRISNAGITTICGVESPGSLLELNNTAPLFASVVDSARKQDCVRWKRRRVTQ